LSQGFSFQPTAPFAATVLVEARIGTSDDYNPINGHYLRQRLIRDLPLAAPRIFAN
jgi:hypothetical protein